VRDDRAGDPTHVDLAVARRQVDGGVLRHADDQEDGPPVLLRSRLADPSVMMIDAHLLEDLPRRRVVLAAAALQASTS
jgi:hypothetical protein